MSITNGELAEKVARVDESTKSAHKRIDETQDVIKAFYSMAGDVKVLAEQLINMKDDMNYLKLKVNERNEEPAKLMFNLKSCVINGVVMALVSAVMILILK